MLGNSTIRTTAWNTTEIEELEMNSDRFHLN